MIIIIFIFKTTKNKPTTLSDSVAKCPKAVKSEQVKYHCVRENAIIRCSARQINVIFELHVMIQICEIQGDNVHPPSLPAFRKQSLCNGDPTSTSSQKQAAKRKHKTPQGPKNKTRKSCTADSATVPDASSKQPARKQLVTTHVVSDDDGNSDEAVITSSCDNLDCKALLLENKSLKDKIRKLQNRLEIAGKGRV